jgi:hypothetical protein
MSADRRVAAEPLVPRYTRRHLLAIGGALGAGLVLAACGGDTPVAVEDTEVPIDPEGLVVAQRYPQSKALTPGEVRLAISLASTDGALVTQGPDVLRGVIRDAEGTQVATFETPRRGEGLVHRARGAVEECRDRRGGGGHQEAIADAAAQELTTGEGGMVWHGSPWGKRKAKS